MATSPRTRMLAYIRQRHPHADDEEHYARLEQLELAAEWHRTQIVRLSCSKCGATKPTSAFRLDHRTPSGFHAVCKACEQIA